MQRFTINGRFIGYALVMRLLLLATIVSASPTDDFARVVFRGGAATIQSASAEQFLRACSVIFLTAKEKEIIWYVNAAVKLRPDLADRTVIVALNARISANRLADKEKLAHQVCDIVQAAILAEPAAAPAIVKAAIKAVPFARSCIVAAAITAVPDLIIAILDSADEAEPNLLYAARRAGELNGPFEPFALMDPKAFATDHVNSPEQPPLEH